MHERLLIDTIKIVENHTEDTELTHEFSRVRVEFVENVTFNDYGQIVGNRVLIFIPSTHEHFEDIIRLLSSDVVLYYNNMSLTVQNMRESKDATSVHHLEVMCI